MQTKKEYLDLAYKRYNYVIDKLDKLYNRTKKTKEETIRDMEEELNKLQLKKEDVNAKYKTLESASEENWDVAKKSFEDATEDSIFDRFRFMMLDTGDKVKELSEWADENFESFYDKAKKRLDEWGQKIYEFERKSENSSKESYEKEITYLKKKREELNNRLKEISGSSEGAWKDLKKGFSEAGKSLSNSFRDAFKHF